MLDYAVVKLASGLGVSKRLRSRVTVPVALACECGPDAARVQTDVDDAGVRNGAETMRETSGTARWSQCL